MFARYFVDLDMPFGEVERALLRSPESWLPGAASRADAEGDRLLAEVGFGSGLRIHKEVETTLRDPIRAGGRTILPLSWRASGPAGIFPSLEADIEIAPMGRARTQLAVSARYTPPLGPVGKAIDRGLLHRVAEATIRDFVHRVAASLESGRVPVGS